MTNKIQKYSLLICLFLLTACGGESKPPEEILRPVRYQRVFATGGERERMFSGISHAGLESRLSFKVRGTVKRIPVRVNVFHSDFGTLQCVPVRPDAVERGPGPI